MELYRSSRPALKHTMLTTGCPLRTSCPVIVRCHPRKFRERVLFRGNRNAAAAGSESGLCENGLVSMDDDMEAHSLGSGLSCAPDVAFLIPSMPSDTSDVLDCPHIRDLLTAQVCVHPHCYVT